MGQGGQVHSTKCGGALLEAHSIHPEQRQHSQTILTTLLSGQICLISPLKKDTTTDWPSADTSLRVPSGNRICRDPSSSTVSTWTTIVKELDMLSEQTLVKQECW